MLIIITVGAILLMGGGAAAFVLLKPAHTAKPAGVVEEAHPVSPPKYIELGTFTSNLIHEEGDRYLQVAISLKITNPELEEKIKASNPEILHRVNMLLQSKSPSELATLAGKEKLARDIKMQVEYVMGFRKSEPSYSTPAVAPNPEQHAAVSSPEPAAVHAEAGHAAEAVKSHAENAKETNSGIAEVLFTSFIIQ
jgi:flagellar FliL protein